MPHSEQLGLCDNLLTWLDTFRSAEVTQFTELTDGIVIASVLCEIAPAWFDESWKDGLKQNISDNWRLKVSNLRKIKTHIMDYYQEVLDMDLVNFPMPDCAAIGEKEDEEALGRLLQLVLGCAVHCDTKEDHINGIQLLDEQTQLGVMTAIQELMQYEMPRTMHGSRDYEVKLKESHTELDSAHKEVEITKQKVHDLEIQLQIMKEENSTLVTENERLDRMMKNENRLSMMNISDPDIVQGTEDKANISQLIEDFHSERFQLENVIADKKIACELLEAESNELRERCNELQEAASNSKRLQDEVDELRYKVTSTAKLEQQVESYKKRLEEIPDLRTQIKALESQNDIYVQQKVSLEDENKKFTSYKNQIEKYKIDIRRVQDQLMSETKRADKASIECDKFKTKCDSLDKINLELANERSSLKEAISDMEVLHNNSSNASPLAGHMNANSGLSPETKEMIARLKNENNQLKSQLNNTGGTNTDIELLQMQLDDSKQYETRLQEDLREAHQKLMKLESDIELQSEAPSHTTLEIVQLQDTLAEEKTKHKETNEMLDKKNNRIKELEPRVKSAAEAINSLKDIIKKKDDEIKAQEEKYKRFLGKAKQVIKAIDPKGAHSPSPDTAALRKQLAEKERALARMEEEAERLKTTREREERMVLSAWYEMGMHVHKKGLEERLSPQVNSPRSVMAQKRNELRRSTVSGKSPSANRT